jgi:hypothetical protein
MPLDYLQYAFIERAVQSAVIVIVVDSIVDTAVIKTCVLDLIVDTHLKLQIIKRFKQKRYFICSLITV